MYLMSSDEYYTLWERVTCNFLFMSTENGQGYKCYVCDRQWFLRDLKVATVAAVSMW